MSGLSLKWEYSRSQLRHTGFIDCRKGFREFVIQPVDVSASVRSERIKKGFDLCEASGDAYQLNHLHHAKTVKELKAHADGLINGDWL